MPAKRVGFKRVRLVDLGPFLLAHYAEHASKCAGKLAAYALEVPQQIKSLKLSLTAVTETHTYKGAWDLSEICQAPYPHLLNGVIDLLLQGVIDQIRDQLHTAPAENQEVKETKL